MVGTYQLTWSFPNQVRILEKFTTPHGFVVDGSKGHQIYGKEAWPLENSMREVASRQVLRQPLAMLKNRTANGLTAVTRNKGKLDEAEVELLAVWLDGATSTWSIDPKTGRILQVQYEARQGTVGDNVVRFADFRDVDCLIVPHQRMVFFNGKEIKTPQVKIDQIEPDGAVKSEIFGLPQGGG